MRLLNVLIFANFHGYEVVCGLCICGLCFLLPDHFEYGLYFIIIALRPGQAGFML